FPGGDIGGLAVNGTVNDLAVSGARPLWLSAGFILEEGFPVADLERIVASMAAAAEQAGVQGATGDTKVVQRGKADGCYINTAGVGVIERPLELGVATAKPGDVVIVSGPIGEHGITIMLARGELDIESSVESDTAPLNGLVERLLDAAPGVRGLRDATRGGVATICNEVARAAGGAVGIDEGAVPGRAGHGPPAPPPARRGPRRHRPGRGRPAGPGAFEDVLRGYPDRRPAGGGSSATDLLKGAGMDERDEIEQVQPAGEQDPGGLVPPYEGRQT